MLPTIPIHLAFHTAILMLTGFTPEVYASRPWLKMNIMDLTHMPPPQSDQDGHWMCCMKRLSTTSVVHQRWLRWLNQQLVFPCLHCLLLVERQVRSALVMALPRVCVPPTHHTLWAGTAKPGLHLHSIIHEVHNPVHLPLALVPGSRSGSVSGNQFLRLIRVIMIRILCWVLCQLLSVFSQ